MKITGDLCPFGNGQHKLSPWSQLEPLPGCPTAPRSGFACVRCSKTWQWEGDVLFGTYELRDLVDQINGSPYLNPGA